MRREETDSMGDAIEIPSAVGRLRLRPERDEDQAFRYRLFCDAREPEFALLAPAAFQQLMTQQFHAQILGYLACFPEARFDIVELSGEPIGRIVVDRSGEVVHIVDQAIAPPWRGRGIGTAIVRALMDEAQAAGVPLRVEGGSENDPSLRLYLRLGFTRVETVPRLTRLEWRPAPTAPR
jgi:RimJ/RimL family protein N-acetyltransferase